MCKSLRVSVCSEKSPLGFGVSNSTLCSSSGEGEQTTKQSILFKTSRPNRLFSEPTLTLRDLHMVVVPASLLFIYSFFVPFPTIKPSSPSHPELKTHLVIRMHLFWSVMRSQYTPLLIELCLFQIRNSILVQYWLMLSLCSVRTVITRLKWKGTLAKYNQIPYSPLAYNREWHDHNAILEYFKSHKECRPTLLYNFIPRLEYTYAPYEQNVFRFRLVKLIWENGERRMERRNGGKILE